mmetsp:Transcript_66653/g.117854  ORF Transcript_66653/g.117854 Transcript_66653/m.117854 type:complete len:1076 (-) Transcript_66653:304-3531(-)
MSGESSAEAKTYKWAEARLGKAAAVAAANADHPEVYFHEAKELIKASSVIHSRASTKRVSTKSTPAASPRLNYHLHKKAISHWDQSHNGHEPLTIEDVDPSLVTTIRMQEVTPDLNLKIRFGEPRKYAFTGNLLQADLDEYKKVSPAWQGPKDQLVQTPVVKIAAPDDELEDVDEDSKRQSKDRPHRRSSLFDKESADLEALAEGTPRQQLQAFIGSPRFEVFFGVLIMMNTVIMAFQTQYRGIQTGFEIGYFGMTLPADQTWPGWETASLIIEWLFGVLFTGEIVLKLIAFDYHFFLEPWNLLDFAVVAAWFIDTLSQGILPIDPMLLRLVRLMKLLRMLRLIRTMSGFDSLYIMITAIKSSVATLMWSVMLLMLLLMMLALFLTTLLGSYIDNPDFELERRIEVFKYYGTFTNSALSMFELTLANWVDASRALTENVSEVWMLFVLFFQACIGFSVMKVIMGVFVHVTFFVAENDDLIMMNSKEKSVKIHSGKMQSLFEIADENGNGRLDIDEFRGMIGDPIVQNWLSAMGFDTGYFNPEDVYRLICKEGQDDLNAEEMCRGVENLKGPATSLNMAVISKDSQEISEMVADVDKALEDLQRKFGIDVPEKPQEEEEEEEKEEEEGEDDKGGDVNKRRSVASTMFDKDGSKHLHLLVEPDTPWRKVRRRVQDFALGSNFELAFAILIGLNTLTMMTEVQYRGFESGFQLGYAGMTKPAHEIWPHAETGFFAVEVFFGALFTFELAAKLVALGAHFVKDGWNVADFAIVFCWYMEATSILVFPVDPMILRLFRLVRVMRMAKLIKFLEKSDSLYLMMTSIKGSIMALAWSSLLLVIIQMCLSLFLGTILETYLRDENAPGDREEIYKYFGTFTRSFLTMFEITIGNWIPVTRAMMRNWSDVYVTFALVHKFVIGFAVVNVITGIFIQETMQVAKTDNKIMLSQREQSAALHVKKMTFLFAAADADGSGRLDRDEWEAVCADPQVALWLSSMGLDVSDACLVHDRICEGKGADDLTAKEMVDGIARLKGEARNLDISVLRRSNEMLMQKALEMQAKVDSIMARGLVKPFKRDESME